MTNQNNATPIPVDGPAVNIAGDIFVRQKVARIQGDCALAMRNIGAARTIPELIRASDITVPSWLRSVVRRELDATHAAAERRAEALIDAQIKSLDESGNADAAANAKARLLKLGRLRDEWRPLGGRFPRLATRVQRIR